MTDHLFEVHGAKEAADGRLAEAITSGHWDMPDVAEAKIHRIHAYPAKFPAFLATRALAYARDEGLTVRRVGDIFCGCGTVAFEATQAGLDFWGCDINPVATLIAQVKGSYFRPERLKDYAIKILEASSSASTRRPFALEAEARLRHWFQPQQFDDLARLLNAIETVVSSRSRYRKVFLCAFSAILKATSQWRQRSTKPALDVAKQPPAVGVAFARQVDLMMRAWSELSPSAAVVPDVHRGNILTIAAPAKLDMIITSPPYVTSYEYADLHQLSALWLGFAADYRTLREGSVGTAQHRLNFRREFGRLNRAGFQIVFSLFNQNPLAARAVANYYLDMQDVARRCKEFLSRNGVALFVIGNTQYSGVNVDNAAHLAEALFDAGFKRVRVTKRRISNKLHTPFRMADGRFSRSAREKQIYSEEYIVIGHR